MRIVTFMAADGIRWGAILDEMVVDLPGTDAAWKRTRAPQATSPFPGSVLAFLQGGAEAHALAEATLDVARSPERLAALQQLGLAFPAAEVTFLPPLPNPGKIICLGHNYRRHVLEMGNELPTHPVFFGRFAHTLLGHGQPHLLTTLSDKVDFEAELMLVIGRRGKAIPREAAFDHIAGYTLFNDISVRDFQRRTPQWFQGKNFDGSGPMGPAIVTADEIPDPQALEITLTLNGEVMQASTTADFIFDIPTIIQELSAIMTLEPGDLIATGTPSGVGFARTPPRFLQPGDSVEIRIAELGTLRTPIVAP